MALTNKLTDIVRNTAYALTTSLALASPLASPLYSAEKPAEPAQNYSQTQKSDSFESKTEYTLEDFKKAYGEENWSKINNTKKKMIEKRWSEINNDLRKDIITIYKNPDDFYKNRLTEIQRKEYDETLADYFKVLKEKNKNKLKSEKDIYPGPIDKAIMASYGISLPWIVNTNNLSQKEILTLYANYLQGERDEAKELEKRLEESKYPFDRFVDILKDKKQSRLTLEQEHAIEHRWPGYNLDYRKTLIEVYANPEKFKKGLEESVKKLSEEEQEDFYSYFPKRPEPKQESLKEKQEEPKKRETLLSRIFSSIFSGIGESIGESVIKEYKEKYPWIDIENPDLGDSIIIYLDERKRVKKSEELFEINPFK